MKKLTIFALILALVCAFALAEDTVHPLGEGLSIVRPADMEAEESDGVLTFVRGTTRAVIQLIPQDLSDEPLKQAARLITVYDERVTDVELSQTEDGLCQARAVIEHCFGEGLHQYPLLVLTENGLLIISVYDLNGDNDAAQATREELAAKIMN